MNWLLSPGNGFARLRRGLLRGGRLYGAAGLLVLLAVRVWNPWPVEAERLRMADFYQQLLPRTSESSPVVIIDIDEQSLAELELQWPWPRTLIAEMIDKLAEAGVAAIAFDVVFAEPDRTSPSIVREYLPNLDDDLFELLGAMPSHDSKLAESFKDRKVVLGQTGLWQTENAAGLRHAERITPIAWIGEDPRRFLDRYPGIVDNIEELDSQAAGRGMFSLAKEGDGVVRRVPSIYKVGDQLIPALSLELLRVRNLETSHVVWADQAGISNILAAGIRIPTDRRGRIWIRFADRNEERYVSAAEVIRGEAAPGRLAGKMALIGTSAAGLGDLQATPLGYTMPGVEIHAQLIETVLERSYLIRPNFALGVELTVIFLSGVLLLIVVPIVGARWTMPLLVMLIAAVAGASWYAFASKSVLIDASYPVVSAILTFVLLAYAGYASEERNKKHIRQAFGRYLSPVVVERLADNPGKLELGGEERLMSIMFADIRGFTTLSERFKDDPKGLTQLVNQFLTPMTDVVHQWNGTIDKYIGDCLMAFWNAPLDDEQHAANACQAALEMLAALEQVNRRLAANEPPAGVPGKEKLPETLDVPGGNAELSNVYPLQKVPGAPNLAAKRPNETRQPIRLKIGIGISTGECLVGNLGSEQRFDYSVLGDPVNFASRLEGQTKNYGVGILISETTRRLAREFAALELDRIVVKGKREAVGVYGLLGDSTRAETDNFRTLERLHGQMLAAYRGQRWHEARELLAACIEQDPSLEGLYLLYGARIDHYLLDPPEPNWDGVFLARTK